MPSRAVQCVTFAGVLALVAAARADEPQLSEFFGFDPLEVVKIDQGAGPILTADMNGDGLMDLIAVNNFKSRIEIHYQKRGAKPDDEVPAPTQVNELPEHWRFRREYVSVSHRVAAVVAHDFDNDGLMDLIYAGAPPEIVFVRQKSAGAFDVTRKHRVKDLQANRNGLAVANVLGDDAPELLSLVNGEIHIWKLDKDNLGEPLVKLSAGATMVAFFLEDYNGDGRQDVVGIIPEDAAPVRLWLAAVDEGRAVLGPQTRFEMPALREFKPVRLPGEAAARMAVIERASKRLVLYNVSTERIAETGDRDAAMRVYSFLDPGSRKRAVAVADVDGDGRLDLLATNVNSNSVVVYRQLAGKGLQPGESYPSLSDLDYLVAGNVDDDPFAEVYVLSEKEGVVGRSDAVSREVPFPNPLRISEGHTPVALALVKLDHGPHVAVVAKDARNYVIDLIDMTGAVETIKLGSLSRSPQTILAIDADQDGRTDLLLFTPEKPMTMLHAEEKGFAVKESKDMGQFGFVSAATADNTAVFDVDGDGHDELLIADKNFVRAVRYVPAPPAGVSPGWQVVEQINANDSTAKLVSLALLRDRIVAADKANNRLVVLAKASGSTWKQVESLNVQGFSFTSIYAGQFSGDDQDNILAVGSDGFAVIRLAGDRVTLDEFDAWRTDRERRMQHELGVGDVNSDGFADLVSLDAGEQMCEIFTFTEAHHLLYATSFKVFESKIFSGGEPKEFEPKQVIIDDITGDGAADLVLLAHDRVLIYPQMVGTAKQ